MQRTKRKKHISHFKGVIRCPGKPINVSDCMLFKYNTKEKQVFYELMSSHTVQFDPQ